MSELSHFEELSTKTPVKQPYAILIGCVVLILVLSILSNLTPTKAVEELKAKEEAQPASAVQPADDGEEI